MPWRETDALKERTKFVLDYEREANRHEGEVNVSALCRTYGISRPTGYRWLERYLEANRDLRALEERSRRPHRSPSSLPAAVVDWIVAFRKDRPSWGARKIRQLFIEGNPQRPPPSESTINAVLRAHGLCRPRKRRRHVPPATRPFADCAAPNDVWCIDFKGQFRMENGRLCYPLTVLDAYSRFLIRCEGLLHPNYSEVWRVLDRAFTEFGLPAAIRTDNGEPWVSTGAGGLTRLSLWWLKLGIRHDRIDPGKPQQNGRQERFHRTLKEETATPPRASLPAQQRAFDRFRKEYNQDRPHEALGQQRPEKVYSRSRRLYPRRPRKPTYDRYLDVYVVDKRGFISWRRRLVFISAVLYGEEVELREVERHMIQVRYGELVLGKFSGKYPARGLVRPRRRRAGKV
jgi:putative transposase